MSKDVNRSQVFKTTRVRTSLKNDASWIHKSNPDEKNETETRTGQVVQTRPFLPRQSSYVLSALRKFETKTPTEEQIQNVEAQAEQSVVNAKTEEKKEHAETVVDQSNVKDNREAAEVSVEVHVEERVPNGEGQTHSSTKSNPEPVSPVEPAEPPVASPAAESKGDKTETAADPSNVQQNDVEASANVKVEDLVAEICAAVGIEEANDRAAVLDALADNLIPQQEALTESDPTNANLENVKVESDVQSSEGSDGKCPSDQAADKMVKVVVTVEEVSPENDVIIATPGGEAAPHDRVDSAPDLQAKPVTESPAQPAAETRLESCESGPAEQAAGETVEAAAEINVETTPEVPVVTAAESESSHQPAVAEAAVETLECKVDSVVPAEPVSQTTAEELVECEVQPSENSAVEHSIEPTPQVASDHLEELNYKDEAVCVTTADAEVGATEPTETSTTNLEEGSGENGHLEKEAEEVVKAVTEIVEESSPAVSDEITVGPGDEAAHQDSVPDLLAKSVSETPTQPPAEAVTVESCESGLPVQVAEETVEAAPEVSLDSSPDISKVTVAAVEETAAQVSVEPVPDVVADIVPESSSQSAAGTVECKVESVVPAEPVLQTRIEEVVECEVQPPEKSAAEQNVESASQATSGSVEESVASPDAEADQDTFAYKVIELTDALDEKPTETEADPEPVKDLEQSDPEETNLSQQLDHSNISEITKPEEKPQSPKVQYRYREKVCSFCDKGIDGTVRIIFSEPLLNCHPECLKCGMCARALGDLLTPMFLHKEVIQCDGCVAKALKT